MNPESLEIRLLGELAVLRGGRALPLPASKRTRALLGYLVASGEEQPRTRLCELLWEGPLDPRAALRWSLTKLRPLVDDPAARRLGGDRERVRFDPAGAEVDLESVAHVLADGVGRATTADLRAAARHFRGELLEGLDLPDCYRWHAWLAAEREAWRARRRAVLATLVERLAGTPEEALRHARAWVGIDPLDEPAQAAVVRLLGELGRGREALDQYESCRRMLRQELAAAPGEALEAARRGLARRAAEPAAVASTAPILVAVAAERAPGIVGRERERAGIAAALDAAAAGRGGPPLLFLGEPGIGKSRLLAELAAGARARGGTALYGRAFEAEMVRPYGAWIDALRSTSLPALAEDAGDRGRLFEAVARQLASLGAAGKPTVVVLDDLHWIDDASAALFHYVARVAGGGSRLLLAGAARPGELADNPAALRLVRALARETGLLQIELAPFSAVETAELVAGAEPAAPTADAARVFAESRGNPLFALEVARALARGPAGESPEAGLVDDRAGLHRLLAERLAALPERVREILPWAAAFGHGFAAELLGVATGLPAAELLSALHDLERHGILRALPEAPESLDFAHDLLRQAAYRQLSEPRRRLLHRQIARALCSRPDPEGAWAGDLAHHAALGGDDELAATAALAAGERSLRLFAGPEAAALAERGLARVRGLPRATRLRLQAGLLRVYVHASRGRRRAAELAAELQALVAEAQGAGLHAEVQTGLYLLSVLAEESGDFARAEAHSLHAAAAGREADPGTAVRALANTGRCLAQLEREHGRAVALLAEAQAVPRGPGAEPIDLPWGLGLTRLFAGDETGAVRHLSRALDLARASEDHWSEWECAARLTMIDLEAGRPAAALARVPALVAVAGRLGEGSEAPMSRTLAALARLGLPEDPEEREGGAEAALDRALDTLRAIDTKGFLAYVQNLAAELDLAAGRRDEAVRRAAEALTAATAVERESQITLARVNLARAALAAGDHKAAAAQLAAAPADPDRVSARARRALADAGSNVLASG